MISKFKSATGFIKFILITVICLGFLYGVWYQVSIYLRQKSVPEPSLKKSEALVSEKITDLTARIKMDLYNSEKWGHLGMNLHVHHFLDEAKICYEKAQELAPTEFAWPYFMAVLLTEQGNSDESLVWFEKARELNPDYAPLYIREGDLYFSQGKPDLARTAYQSASKRGGEPYFVFIGLAEVAMAQSKLKQAKKFTQLALVSKPQSKEALDLMAEVYRRQKNTGGLEKLKARSDSLLHHTPRFIDSVADYLAKEGVSHEWYGRRGNSYLDQKLWSSAAREFLEQVKIDPNPGAFENLNAAVFLLSKDTLLGNVKLLKSVVKAYKKGKKLYPENVSLLLNYGSVLAAQGKWKESTELFSKSLALDSNVLFTYKQLGNSLKELNNNRGSSEIFSLGLLRFPENKYLETALAWLWVTDTSFSLQDRQKSLSIATRLAKTDNPSANILHLLSVCHFSLGHQKKAVKIADEALNLARLAENQTMQDEISTTLSTFKKKLEQNNI